MMDKMDDGLMDRGPLHQQNFLTLESRTPRNNSRNMSSDAGSLWTETVEHWLQEDTERSVIGPRCARTKDVLHIDGSERIL
jgi:hypothetical protein